MLQIREEAPSVFAELGRIPISFWVTSVYDVADAPEAGFALRERAAAQPWLKNYDTHAEDEPAAWGRRFDVTRWGAVTAWDGARRIGSIVIAWDTPGVRMLEDRSDLGVVWDLRLSPEWRRQGVGTELFGRAEAWMAERRCRLLEVETQNVNVPACRFYERMGCSLGAANRLVYPEAPEEVQLLWYKPLAD